MMKCELNSKRRCSQLDDLPGSAPSVVPVKEHSLGEWKPENNHDRCNGSTDHTEVGMHCSAGS